jgi:hypothetical protein
MSKHSYLRVFALTLGYLGIAGAQHPMLDAIAK